MSILNGLSLTAARRPKVVMAAGLIATGIVSVMVGMSLASCHSGGAGGGGAASSSARPAVKAPAGADEIGSVTALVGVPEEPEMRVRVAEGATTARFSGADGFWVVPVETLGSAAGGGVVRNSKSERIRGPLEVSVNSDAWIVRDGVDKVRHYPIREPGKAGTRDLEIEGMGPDDTSTAVISLNDVKYAGRFRVTLPNGTAPLTPPPGAPAAPAYKPAAGSFDIVEYVGLETYLPGVVAKELYKEWPLIAFKVQAVCARSYAIHERQRSVSAGRKFDVEAGTRDQAYGGATGLPVAIDAVKQTRGVVLAYGTGVLRAYYSSTCGGRAASAADTWPTYKGYEFNLAPPIQGYTREYACDKSPLFEWQVQRPKDELVRRIALFGERNNLPVRNIRDLIRVEVSRSNSTERPAEFRLTEAGGAGGRWYTLKAEEFRLACNTDDGPDQTRAKSGGRSSSLPPVTRQTRVNSSDVEVLVDGSTVFIRGHGFGHGVGMCQYCTKAMAERGDPWLVILHKFYPGARVVRAY